MQESASYSDEILPEGKYLVVEGPDGTGKTTQVEMIKTWLKEVYNIETFDFQEPGGNEMADAIRHILKDGTIPRIDSTDALLFTAARNEVWNGRALQELKLGKWVVTGRSYLSTLAYQGYGGGFDIDQIERTTADYLGQKYIKPDYEFILDLDDEEERVKRISKRGELEVKDTFESKAQDFQDRVRQGYLQIAHDRNTPVISANQKPEEVFEEIKSYIKI